MTAGSRTRRTAMRAVAVAVAVTGVVAGMAAPASASVVGKGAAKICTASHYRAELRFVDRGGFTSTVVNTNDCWRGELGGLGRAEKIEVRGIWNTNPSSFLISTEYVNLSTSGFGVTAAGTTTSPNVTFW